MAAVKRSLNVGMVGCGKMGTPILRNMAFKAQGSFYLQIHSREMSKARKVADDIAIEGAAQCAIRLHNTYDTMTKWCDVVVTCLKSCDVAREVLLERPDALLANARRGQIFLEHSTVDPRTAQECAFVAQKRGAHYIDAQLSGSPSSAQHGQLTIMAGGDEEPYNRCLPLMRLYAENIHRVGDPGAGAAAKAVCQMLVGIHTVAAAEAIAMADSLGVRNRKVLFDVLDSTWASSTMLRRNALEMEKLVRNPDQIPKGSPSTVDNLLSDLRLLNEASGLTQEKTFTSFPLYWKTQRIFQRTSTAGVGDRDIASVVHFLGADGDTIDREGGLNDIGRGVASAYPTGRENEEHDAAAEEESGQATPEPAAQSAEEMEFY